MVVSFVACIPLGELFFFHVILIRKVSIICILLYQHLGMGLLHGDVFSFVVVIFFFFN